MTRTIAIKKIVSIASDSAIKLKEMWPPVQRVLTFSIADDIIAPKKNLCISIEKGSLSIAYGSRFLSRIKIRKSRNYPLDQERYPQPEGLVSSVALAMRDFGIVKTDVTLSIPKAWAIIKIAEFPSTIKETLSDVVSYELDRLTPLSPEDAFYDFRVLKEDGKKLTLLIVAAKADSITPYVNALKEKGIHVSRLTVNLSCIGTLCHYMYKKENPIFLEIKEDGYEGALFFDGVITHAFTGSFPTADEKSKIETIMTEIELLLNEAKQEGKPPQIIALLKDSNPTLKEMLRLKMNLPVRILNETDTKVKLSEPQKELTHTVIGGILESLWPKAKGINLLEKGHHEISKTPMTFTIILICAIIVLWVLYIIAPLQIEGTKLNEIDRQITLRKDEIKKIEGIRKEIDGLSNEISTIHNFKGNRSMTLNTLKELTTILPKTAWLTRVKITEPTVEIEGYASSATELLPKLETSKYFEKVAFASPTFRDVRMNSDRFIIKMEREGIKKDEQEKEKGEKVKSEKK
ncbi:MAG: PilN domain-containing protein [Nitrospirota bacterium]|nr:PilN domain-containing protein [Nitrospirota bacterium]MDH5768135.1 PilN domain-containing protein [Nitrospirota bacterium]